MIESIDIEEKFEGNNQTRKIFILPFDLKARDINNKFISPGFIKECSVELQSKTGLNPFIEKKRSKIFNPELSKLIEKVTGVKESDSLNTKLANFIPSVSKDNYGFFHTLFVEGDEKTGLSRYIENILKNTDFSIFCIHLLNEYTNCYEPILFSGLTDVEVSNYIFVEGDKIFSDKQQDFEMIRFDEENRNNPFFEKKFSSNLFKTYQGLYISFKKYADVKISISLFFHPQTKRDNTIITQIFSEIEFSLSGLYPAYKKIQDSMVPVVPENNFLEELVQEVIHFTKNGSRACYFTKITIQSSTITPNFNTIKLTLVSELDSLLHGEYNKIIEYSYNEIIILSTENCIAEVRERTKEVLGTDISYALSNLRYPDEGRNLYLYF